LSVLRSLNRQFREHFGTTPLGLLTTMRVNRARRLLESTGLTVDRVAEQSGFGSYPSLRHHFLRTVGVSPPTDRATPPGTGHLVNRNSDRYSAKRSAQHRDRLGLLTL
jgi:transcriptional regulator GlxA family with amidase domain